MILRILLWSWLQPFWEFDWWRFWIRYKEWLFCRNPLNVQELDKRWKKLFYFIKVPVGKFNGVWTWVIAFSMMSGRNLERANEPLSPTTKTLYELLSALTKALTYLTTPELTPPQRPLSEVTGTRSHFLGVKVCFFFWRKV